MGFDGDGKDEEKGNVKEDKGEILSTHKDNST